MKSIFKYISSALAVAALGISMTACDDWTEPESIDQNYGDISSAEAYADYLENLRAYRHKKHKDVFVWFNNSESAFGSQGERVSALPDSVDVVVLQNVKHVTNQMLEEMRSMRVNKGMQFIYCISFASIKADWTAKCEELAAKRLEFQATEGEDAPIPAELQDPELIDFISEAWTEQLSYFNALGFDGLMAAYDGKTTNYMTPAEKAEYEAQTLAFLGCFSSWHARNPEYPIDFMGKPQHITDHAILNDFRYVFLSGSLTAISEQMLSQVYLNSEGAVADSRLGLVASIPAIDQTEDSKTGFFANGEWAAAGLAEWTAAHEVGAVGFYNAQNDYCITSGDYTNLRQFIQIVNPAAK